jgi:Ca2+-binding RTX toxin-like protein
MATIIKTFGDGNDSYSTPSDSGDDFSISGGGGNDRLAANGGTGGVTIYGNAGDDTISGQSSSPWDNSDGSWLYGGAGNDSIDASVIFADEVQAYGGAGNDTISTFNSTAPTTVSGGSGDDLYELNWQDTDTDGTYPLTLVEAFGGGTDTIELLIEHDSYFDMADEVENLRIEGIWWEGGNSDDTDGTYDSAAGAGGGAFISGNFSNNMIELSDRHDTAYGWTGADTIKGGTGDDDLFGEDGNDSLLGGRHNDSIEGGEGNDSIAGGADQDRLLGNRGNDMMFGDAGADTLLGGDGADRLWGGSEADKLYGEAGNDQLFGDQGNDTLSGGAGNDVYVVTDAGDVVFEIAGNGSDRVETTLLSYSLTAEVEDLIVLGGSGPEATRYATGNALANTIQMQDGLAALMHDSVQGGGGGDNITLGMGNDTGFGDDGNDLLMGDAGADNLVGGNGNDTVGGGIGNDTVNGGTGADQVTGGDGNDSVSGGIANDTVSGGAGADTVQGGDGNDMVYGSAGADRLFGGAGVDWFNYTAVADSNVSAGRDFVMDFVKGEDKVNLGFMDADATAAGNQDFYFASADVIAVSPGNVWMREVLTGTLIEGDVTGDFVADFAILVYGVTGMAQSDVIL